MIRELVICMEFTSDTAKKERNKQFALSQYCVSEYFVRLFDKLKIGKIQKLVIECDEEPITKITNYDDSDIKTLRRQVDINKYLKLSDTAKKKWLVEMWLSGFEELHKHFDFDIAQVHEAAKQIEAAKYVNHYAYGKQVASTDKKHKAQLFIEFEMDRIDLYLEVFDKEGTQVKRVLVKSELPYWDISGSVKWLDAKSVSVLDSKKKQLKKVSV